MIPRDILEQALADYEEAVKEIQEMEYWKAVEYLIDNNMNTGLCYYLNVKVGICHEARKIMFGSTYLGGSPVLRTYSFKDFVSIPDLTYRLQLRIDKLKELINEPNMV